VQLSLRIFGGNMNRKALKPGPKGMQLSLCERIARNALYMSFVIALSFILAGASFGATYYVSPTGNASWNSCTSSSTPCPAQTAMRNAVAGDIVNFLAGTYNLACNSGIWDVDLSQNYEWSILTPDNSGTSGNPITFRANPGDTVILKGGNSGAGCTTGGVIGAFGPNSYITWDGFTIDTSGYPSTKAGTAVNLRSVGGAISNITVQNMDLIGHYWNYGDNYPAIYLLGVSYAHIDNVKVHGWSNNSPNGSEGILSYNSSYLIVEHYECYNNDSCVTDKQEGQHNIYRYSYFHDLSSKAFAIEIMTQGGNTNDIQIYQNVFNVGSGIKGINLDNTISGGLTMSNVKIYNNVLYNSGDITFYATGGYAEAWNNIIYKTGSRMLICDQYSNNCGGISYMNYNHFYSSDGSGQTFTRNATDYNLTQWRSQGFDANSITGNPNFVNPSGGVTGFKLQNGSPALNTGINRQGGGGSINMGAYITGNEIIGAGLSTKIPNPPTLY
jgi:hypothetical protein